MPYLDPSLEEDNKNTTASGASTGGQAPILGQSSGLDAGGAAGKSTGPSQEKPSSSGQFTNLQSYLDANKDSGFGDQVAGRIQSDVDKASQAETNADSTFRPEVDKSTVNYDPTLVNSAISDPSTFANGPADQLNKFYSQRDASYTGPKSFSDDANLYGQTYGAVANAGQEANLSKNEDGRKALLQNFYTNPQYSGGQQGLDNLLLQNDPSAQQAFQNVQQNADQTTGNFQNLQNSLNSYAQQGNKATQTAQDNTRKALTDAATGIDSTLGTSVDAYNAKLPDAFNTYKTALAAGQVPGDLYSALTASNTVDPSKAAPVSTTFANYGVDPLQYLKQGDLATKANMIDSGTNAKLGALMKLGSGVIDPKQYSYVNSGTQALDTSKPYSFDANNFQTAVGTNKDIYNNALNNDKYTVADSLNPNGLHFNSLTEALNSLGNEKYASYASDALKKANAQDLAQAQADKAALDKKYQTKLTRQIN